MDMIADILLVAGALGAAVYCVVLATRLKRFNNLENGVGGAVAVLSVQVDDMTRTLRKAQSAAASSTAELTALTGRAEEVSRSLELMLASMHDLPLNPGEDSTAAPLEPDQAKAELQSVRAENPATPGPDPASQDDSAASGDDAGNERDAPLFLSQRMRLQEAAE